MQIHQLQPNHKSKSRKRVGRGGSHGTYSGRGMKGQMSRAGRKPRPGFAGGDTIAIKRFPKQRGQRGKLKIKIGSKLFRLKRKPVVLGLNELNNNFKDGETVSPKSLLEKGLISRMGTTIPRIKILGVGELKKKVKIRGIEISKQALKKIEQIATITLVERKKSQKKIRPKKEKTTDVKSVQPKTKKNKTKKEKLSESKKAAVKAEPKAKTAIKSKNKK